MPAGRTWKWAIGSALAAALMAWIPNISGYIDAQTARVQAKAAALAAEKHGQAVDKDYEEIRAALEEHAVALEVLEEKLLRLRREVGSAEQEGELEFPRHRRLPSRRPSQMGVDE